MVAEGSYWQEVIAVTGAAARGEARIPGPSRFSVDGRERDAEIEISDRASKAVTTEVVEVDESVLAAGDHHGSTFYQHHRFRDLVLRGAGPLDEGAREAGTLIEVFLVNELDDLETSARSLAERKVRDG